MKWEMRLKLELSHWQRQLVFTSVMFRLDVCLPHVCCTGHRIYQSAFTQVSCLLAVR